MTADLTALLMLAQAATPEQADEILDRLADPWTRNRLRDEWNDHYWSQVQLVGPPACLCSHSEAGHFTDRRGRVVCSSAACGCAQYRTGGTK